MLLYLDDRFADHDTGQHPECPDRIRRINQTLRDEGWLERSKQRRWEPCSNAILERIHSSELIRSLEKACSQGGGRIEADTVVSQDSFEVAKYAAGAAVDAVDRVLKGEDHRAFCAVRPPGHHARPKAPMGFCLLNNVAIAAKHAVVAHQLDRVLIIDFDVHHGNGTQESFYSDPSVLFLSMHRFPFYPGTGDVSEIGTGPGLGTTKNIPVEYGTTRKKIIERFERGCDEIASAYRPQLVLLSAGFDAHRNDPVGDLGLEQEDYETLTNIVVQVAKTTCDGRIISLLEGGYNLDWLPRCVLTHLESLNKD
ncbi:MAG: histone deacetylase [Pirellulaceae bacterium]|nr:histone deacetylase [Pirellulaceae bacterium]